LAIFLKSLKKYKPFLGMKTQYINRAHLTLLLLCLYGSGFTQSKIDSLEKVLTTATGNLRAEALYILSWEYRFADKEKALRYGEEGLRLAHDLKDTGAIASALNSISETWLNFGDYDQAEKITREELPYARAIPQTKNLLGALTRLGTINYRRGKFDEALVYQLEVQREAEKINKPEIIGVASLNLGLTYMDLKRYDEAMQYFLVSLDAFEKLEFAAGIGACYVNIAETLRNQKKYREAEAAAYKGEDILQKSGNKLHLGYIYTVLGKLYRETGDQQKRLEYQQKALALAQENNDDFMTCANQTSLGRTFLERGDLAAAKKYLDDAVLLSAQIGEKSVLLEAYAHLRDWHLLRKDFAEATRYDEKFTGGMDSVFNAKMAGKVADAQTKYETEKKEAEIKTQKLELFRQRTWIYGLLAGLFAFVILGYLFYNRYRLRKKTELDAAVIREQQLGLNAVIEAQEAERKRIAQELHDSIAQEMAAIRMGFSVLQRKLAAVSPQEAERIGELAQQLDQSCTEVRSISHVMMPPALEQQGLAPSLELLLHNTLQYSELNYMFEHTDVPENLNEKTKLGLYRIAQELLNNIVKHAKATRVVLMLYPAGNHLLLRLEDDGQGFDFEQARAKGNMGLLNIISRVSTLGGTFQAEPGQPRGTFVTVRVPLQGRVD
jgi:signal transduction histidine kinase